MNKIQSKHNLFVTKPFCFCMLQPNLVETYDACAFHKFTLSCLTHLPTFVVLCGLGDMAAKFKLDQFTTCPLLK